VFVVAAREQEPGHRAPGVPGRPTWLDSDTEPIGIHHAAAPRLEIGAPRLALCGADLTGWIIFPSRPFDPHGTGSCQDCSQLLLLTASRQANDKDTAPGSTGPGSLDDYSAGGPLVDTLTDRERLVLHHLAELLTVEEIAAAMFVSKDTVRSDTRSIARKLRAEPDDGDYTARRPHLRIVPPDTSGEAAP